jgi:Protein of unknown function (DUF2568)
MAGLKAANLGLKFLLELVAIAAFAYWGASHSPVILAVILAIAIPAGFVAAWGVPTATWKRGGRFGTRERPERVKAQVLPDEDERAVGGELDDVWRPARAGVAGEPGRE